MKTYLNYGKLSPAIRTLSLSFALVLTGVAGRVTQTNAVEGVPVATARPTDANGQLLMRVDGQYAGTGTFTFYRAAGGTLYAFTAGHCALTNEDVTYIGVWQDRPVEMCPLYVNRDLDYAVFSVVPTLGKVVTAIVETSLCYQVKGAEVTDVGSFHSRWEHIILHGEWNCQIDGMDVYDMPGVVPGYSGSGVYDVAGKLVGIVIRGADAGYAGALPITVILADLTDTNHKELLP